MAVLGDHNHLLFLCLRENRQKKWKI